MHIYYNILTNNIVITNYNISNYRPIIIRWYYIIFILYLEQ